MSQKRCTRCYREQPAENFPANRRTRSGLDSWCYECRAVNSRLNYRRRNGYGPDSTPMRERGKVHRNAAGEVVARTCADCKRTLGVAAFHKDSRQAAGLASYCKECKTAQSVEGHLRRTYGLSVEAARRLRAKQRDRCAVCGADNPTHVDHDHASGRVRGLLCENCNMGLGQFKDDPELLRKAAAYLGRHRRAAPCTSTTAYRTVTVQRHVVR